MSGLSCGSCTLCCTVMRVEMSPPKPAYKTCRHCTGTACGIYDRRPEACSGFQCLWLATQQAPQWALPAAMRPDRCGIAIDLNAAGTVIAHCARPGSWRREPMLSWLLNLAAKTNVILELPVGAELLKADGTTDALVKIGVHESGNRLYARVADLDRAVEAVA